MFVLRSNRLLSFVVRHFRSLYPFLTATKIGNIVRACLHLKAGSIRCGSRPFMYRIDPCSACNLRCPPCHVHSEVTDEKRIMDLSDFEVVIEKIKRYALRASLYDLGEPLLNPHIYAMIRHASDRGISTAISTHFNRFSSEQLEALFASRLTVLEPCLDGYSQAAYETYRRGGDVETVKRNIRLVTEHKRMTGSRWPVVDAQVILFDHLRDELPLIETFLEGCGVDRITYRREDMGFNSPETTLLNNQETCNNRCFYLYFGMTIRPDGRVYPCDRRGFNRFSYGSILESPLDGIWNNRYYQFSRALFVRGPDLPYDEELEGVPCLKCDLFRKRRSMCRRREKPIDPRSRQHLSGRR